MSWQCLRCGGIDRHLTGCPDLTAPLVITIPAVSEKAVIRVIGPSGEEKVYIAKDELDRLRFAEDYLRRIRLALGNDYGDLVEIVKRLWTVAEAAKRYRNVTKPGAWPWDRIEELRIAERELDEALAAIKRGGEEDE